MIIRTSKVKWNKSHRLIPSKYPPIDLFDDISDPEDWEVLAKAESRTNPRIYDRVGELSLIPKERRISGVGASWVMAAFTHISQSRHTRFSDGSYGVYYCTKTLETAFKETCYHISRFLLSTEEEAGWITEMRELVAPINADFHDMREGDYAAELDIESYAKSQKTANDLRSNNSNGIIYPSVRHPKGECLAIFWPDVLSLPKQGSHWQYHWNGKAIDYIKQLDGTGQEHRVLKL